MKTSNRKALIIIGIIALISVLNFFIPSIFSSGKYLILLGVVLGLLYYLMGINFSRKANDIKIIRNILIYVLGYYLVTYLLGLVTGFTKSVYSYKLSNVIYNMIPSMLSIIGVEIIRGELIQKTNKDKLVSILTCILFTVFEISISFTAYNLYVKDDIYQFFGLLVVTSITSNILMTIIHSRTDKFPAIIYRLLMETLPFLLLIGPDLGPYLKSVALIILPVLIGISLINMDKKTQSGPKKAKLSKRIYLVVVAILLVVVLLNSGLFTYQTLVIGSDSMKPFMARGDVVLIEQTQDHNKFSEGDILVFNYDNKIVCHRIVKKVQRDGVTYYKTKGDNNDQEDLVFISKNQIKGKAISRIKYIGLPSIWLSDLFK